jgi:hypothetical protein
LLTWLVALLLDSAMRSKVMAGWRRAIELALSDGDVTALAAISRSRTEPASRVQRTRMLLTYRENLSLTRCLLRCSWSVVGISRRFVVTRKFGRYWRHRGPERAFSPDQLGRKSPISDMRAKIQMRCTMLARRRRIPQRTYEIRRSSGPRGG